LRNHAIHQQTKSALISCQMKGQGRISKHVAFNYLSGTLPAGSNRELMITLQHSLLHEIQAIESHAIQNLTIQLVRRALVRKDRQRSGVCISLRSDATILFSARIWRR